MLVTEEQLITELENNKIHVAYLTFPMTGAYFHAKKLIIINIKQAPSCQLSALAHEAIHAKHGHDGHQSDDIELRVEEEAAQILISPTEYALAEQLCGRHTAPIAEELGVSIKILEAYRRILTRLNHVSTY